MKGKISVIIPCLNEEKEIISVLEKIKKVYTKLNINGEVIVVDDGSTDRTYEYAQNYSIKNSITKVIDFKVIRNEKNMGIGTSFMNGVIYARSEFVVMIPGDGENNPIEVLKFFNALKDSVELIIPFVVNAKERGRKRYYASKLFTRIINLIFNTTYNYTNGTVIYKRNLYLKLSPKAKGFFYQTEALIRLKTLSETINYVEVPTKINPNELSRVSRAFRFKTLREIIFAVVCLFWDVNSNLIRRNKRFTEEKSNLNKY